MAKVKTETIHGTEVEFEVDSKGRFSARLDDHGDVAGTTLAEVEDQVTKILKRQKSTKAIEITILGLDRKKQYGGFELVPGAGAIDVTLRGYAERTRDWLLTVDGKKQKLSKGYSDGGPVLVEKLDAEGHRIWKELQEDLVEAQEAIAKFTAARKLDWKKALGVEA